MPAENRSFSRQLATAALKYALSRLDKRPSVAATSNPTDGAGVSVESLKGSYAHVVDARKENRKIIGSSISMDVIANAIRAASGGSMQSITDLSRETIDVDPHLGSVLQKRFGAVASLPMEIQAADGSGVDKEKALFYATVVRDQLRKLPGFRKNIIQLAWGLFDGRAALESHWSESPSPLIDPRFGRVSMNIASLQWIHPRRLSFGTQRQLIVTNETSSSSGNFGAQGLDLSDEALKERQLWRKFVSWTPQLFGQYPEKEGLAPRCLYWSFFKRFAAKDMMTLLELFGKPWRIIEVPEESSANKEDIEASLETVDALGDSYTAVLAKGTKVSVEQPGRTAGQVHEYTIKEVDQQISKLVLGQTGTTDGVPAGLNSDQANVMQEEQLLILKNDADAIGEVIEQQLTDAIIEINFGPKELVNAPRFVLRSDRPADRNSEISRMRSALEAGLEIKVTEGYEVAGFQIPEEDDPRIRIDQPRMEPGATQTPVPRAVIIDPTKKDNGTVGELEDSDYDTDDDEDDDEDDIAAGGYISLGNDDNDETVHEQPSTEFGSPEDLIQNHRRAMLKTADKWADQIAAAIGDKDNPSAIKKAVKAAVEKLDVKPYATALEQRMTHGAALGALDNALDIGDVKPSDLKASRLHTLEGVELSFSDRPFKDALEDFTNRAIIAKETWKKLTTSLKKQSFTVAGIETQAMRIKIFSILEREIGKGADLRQFRKEMIAGLKAAGMISSVPKSGVLSATHVDTVFRTNVLTSYNYGRAKHATQKDVLERYPVWEITGVNDSRTRKAHRAAHGKKLLATDPFWKTAYTPFGHKCRCRVRSLPKKYLKDVVPGNTILDLPDRGFVCGINFKY